MENTKFMDVLKSYESKVEDVNYDIKEKNQEELSLINNDVCRTKFLGEIKHFKEVFLTRLLHDLLVDIPLPYIQGMSEVCAVLVYFYFSKEIDELELTTENCDDETYKNIRMTLKSKYENVRIVIINVILRKFDPLVKDGFNLYEEYNTAVNIMLKRRHIKIKNYELLAYMGSILTFFYRNVTTMENAYKIYEIILSCPPSAPFLLLVIFYDTISKKNSIEKIDNNLYKSVIALEDEFIKILDGIKSDKGCFLKRNAIVIGGVIGFLAAVVAYKINKSSKD